MTSNSTLAILCLALYLPATPVLGQTSLNISRITMELTDKADAVTPELIDEWVKKAENGDVGLMTEFAAAYLYRNECGELKYGHRCRAMAARPEVGLKFLSQIINTPIISSEAPEIFGKRATRTEKIFYISRFQEDFAESRLHEALNKQPKQRPNPDDPACKDFIKYISLAAEHRDTCTARKIATAYSNGICTEKNLEKAKYYFELDFCPIE